MVSGNTALKCNNKKAVTLHGEVACTVVVSYVWHIGW